MRAVPRAMLCAALAHAKCSHLSAPALPLQKPAVGKSNENFRARRLSVSDIDTSEFDKASGKSTTATPEAGGKRGRRMSMR